MRLLLMAAVAAMLMGAVARAETTFQPEVLLMRTAQNGKEKSFDYVRMKPAVATGTPETATFMYRADGDTVTCTITVDSASAASVRATLMIQRVRTAPDGREDTTTKTQKLDLRPGKKLIVENQPHLESNGVDGDVEVLQVGLAK
ncbi:MAG TPA: hypothetical protein VGM37_04880 [Armatimonadota bacterium]|jgi:hypothetical protein